MRKKKIILPAHFKVCEKCGQHGHIIYSDGSKGEVVVSESDALAQLEQARKDSKLHAIEVEVVTKQILDSSLSSSMTLPIIALGLLASALSEATPSDIECEDSRVHLN